MKRVLCFVLVSLIISIFMGCSFDTTGLVSSPTEVKPGGNANVILANIFTYMDTSAIIPTTIKRDSLHLLVGLPSTWEVESASFALIDNFDIGKTEGDVDVDSLKKLIPPVSEFIPMNKDANLINFMKGKDIVAYGGESESLEINTNNIPKWVGFSAPVNIILEKGRRNDLVIPYDSVVNIMGGVEEEDIDLKPAFLGKVSQMNLSFDSIGTTIIPIMININLRAGKEQGKDTILYFTKTAAMNESPSPFFDMLKLMAPDSMPTSNYNWSFTYITVSENANVKMKIKEKISKGNVSIEQLRGYVLIRYNRDMVNPKEAEIYSLKGNLVKKILPNTKENYFRWDGTNNLGARVSKGTYYVRILDKRGTTFTQSINILE